MKKQLKWEIAENWSPKNYQQFLKKLETLQDQKFREFQSKLILNEMPLIGIRTPLLQEIAQNLSTQNYLGFIKYNSHHYFEETMLHGLILRYLNIDFKTLLNMLDRFLPYNTNWAINDIVCTNLKQFKKNQQIGYKWILNLLASKNPWDIRFGFVLLLNHYMTDTYIDSILKIITKPYIDHYYVNMAIAWLTSICYIKYPEKTILILENNLLNPWIHNKTISKIRDSKQISKQKKDYLNTLKK